MAQSRIAATRPIIKLAQPNVKPVVGQHKKTKSFNYLSSSQLNHQLVPGPADFNNGA
jgi:hypothetical protein